MDCVILSANSVVHQRTLRPSTCFVGSEIRQLSFNEQHLIVLFKCLRVLD